MITEIGPIDPQVAPWPTLSDRVVVVFGGVTRSGDRRARRQLRRAVAAGCDAVWFDAWEGVVHLPTRVERHVFEADQDQTVVVVGYRALERNLLVNRLPNGNRFIRQVLERRGLLQQPGVVRTMRVFDALWGRLAFPVLVAVAKVARGRMAWPEVAPLVAAVADHLDAPECLIFTDDHSLPVAWNAARFVWRDCPASNEFIEGARGRPR